jgi:hypothetical protein
MSNVNVGVTLDHLSKTKSDKRHLLCKCRSVCGVLHTDGRYVCIISNLCITLLRLWPTANHTPRVYKLASDLGVVQANSIRVTQCFLRRIKSE